ncbi:MAG: hypothetical protein ABIP93_20425 [Gemmatimonadaceae bacterium]
MLISQQLRSHDLVRFRTSHFGLAAVAGLQMELDAVSIAGLMLVRCNRAEWETAERGYVFKDWHSSYYDANPVFIYHPYEGPVPAPEVMPALDSLGRDGTRLVTACRLFKQGHLLDPQYTARFLVSDGMRERAVGPYRTEYLAMPIDGMTWPLEESEVDDLAPIYRSLEVLGEAPGMESFSALLDAFNLAHTRGVSTLFRLHVLFTVHEMLFDGFASAAQLSTNPYDRALAAVRLTAPELVDDELEALYTRRTRGLRNAIVHHEPAGAHVDVEFATSRLRYVASLGIRLLMRMHHLSADPRFTSVARSLGWRKLGARERLNACLDRAVKGDVAPFEQVMSFQ